MKILIVNGPNLNFLGKRDANIYGKGTYDELCNIIKHYCADSNIEVVFFQSNHEGDIIDALQQYYDRVDGIVINAGAFTHYSYAIRDAIEVMNVKVVEVHISDIFKREQFRRKSVISDVCDLTICGKGFDGYLEAVDFLKSFYKN